MKSFTALAVLLVIGSSQASYLSPYVGGHGYGYPGYAPYAVPAVKIPAPEKTELKVETIEAPKGLDYAYTTPYAAPYVGGYTAHHAAPYVAGYAAHHVAPYTAGYAAHHAAPYAAGYVAPHAAPYAAGYGYPASSQFHSQDEFGNLKFGYSNINSAKHEHGNTYGGVAGRYQYVDANGVLQSVSYVADGLGFRTVDSRLPVAPAVPEAEPLVQAPAPVFEGKQIPDTPEVAAAKAEFQKTFDDAVAAGGDWD
uniref:Putative cuticle protein n=2 Tax=Lepeophtheirus salmonis TaxID=72036 RepID=A7TZ67_LEPSM|nr:putative cuticle protein [Lepeophtheirus salmonis]